MKNQFWAVVIGIGLALCGYFIYCGIDNMANKDRFVTVKGLSEREVMADKVTWRLSVKVTGNQSERLYDQLEPKLQTLRKYLTENGVSNEEIVPSAPYLYDRSDWYNWAEKKAFVDQFELTGYLTVVSDKVEMIRDINLKQQELLKLGVLIDNSMLNYEYSGLNTLKPEMVQEATQNARVVADKFAEDAKCQLGSIRTARQGQFEVTSNDVFPYLRQVRVVVNIDYYLK